jgi:RND superfamily putative drug exporter
MKRLATIVTRHPWRVLIVWLVLAVSVIGATSPGGLVDPADVMETDQAAFLPDRYESARAAQLEKQGFPKPDGATASIVVRRTDRAALTSGDIARAGQLAKRLGAVKGVRLATADRAGVSPNHKVLLGAMLFDRNPFDGQLPRDVDRVRDRGKALFAGSGLVAAYAGDAPTMTDAIERSGITSQLTMLVILVLLVVLFRSLVVGIFDVLLIALVGAVATATVTIGAKLLGFSINLSVTNLMAIVVLGVGTDYVVFLLHRYRERLRAGDEPRAAMHHAITRIGPAIGFSALTVVVSLSAMLLSSMSSLRVLGPALGFGVLATLAAALTLVPAAAVLMRRKLFWPSRERADRAVSRPSGRVVRLVSGKPLGALVASTLVLVALAVPALGFKPDYDLDATVPGSPSEKALTELERGFPQGALEPATVLVRRDGGGRLDVRSIAPIEVALKQTRGIGQVLPPIVSRDGRIARFEALLDVPPFTNRALDTISEQVRPAVAAATPHGMTAEVGGSSSTFVDVRDANRDDQRLIFPAAALLVGLILFLLLRSVAVPAFVMTGVALGFLAALGATVVAFQAIGGERGLNFQLPVIVYLFVASMVSDYAILILSRIREELAAGKTPAQAAAIALRTAGPSVTAAGVVLAASFAVLVISPSLADVGFAIAVGILLSAVVTARVFIPSLTVLAGRRGWWPSRLAETPRTAEEPPRVAEPEPEPVPVG